MSSKRDSSPKDKDGAKTPAFNNSSLKDQLSRWKTDAKKAAPPPPPPRAVHRPSPPPPPPGRAPKRDLAEDDAFFRAAMEEVQPIARAPGEPAPAAPQVSIREVNEDAEALAKLAELVATGEGLDLTDTDEYVEGLACGVDRGVLDSLRRGDFSVQAHLDLHGLLPSDAHIELERFLVESRRRGHRCVLIIHGRGLHSKDQEPVLKPKVVAWLSRGRLARMVLGFATARPTDGGAGALYVLLRR